MKKQKRVRSRFIKNLVVLTSLAFLAIGCGSDNTSGNGTNTTVDPYSYGTYPTTGTYSGQYGNYSMEQILSIVSQENTCAQGGTRAFVQVALQGVSVNMGSSHIGISSYGDIAIVHNNNGSMMDLYICPRTGATGQGQLLQNPVIETSQYCPVGQITAADIVLSGQVQYQVKFAPIHIPSAGRYSSVCQTYY